MPLQPIERGSLASSDIVNDNFEYLDGKITDTASTIQGIDGRLTSQIQTVSNNKANLTLSNVTSLSNTVKSLITNDYAKKDLSNSTSPVVTAPYVKTTYTSGTSGYRIWSDGFCVQWGRTEDRSNKPTVTFIKTFANTNYSLTIADVSQDGTDTSGVDLGPMVQQCTVSGFNVSQVNQVNRFTCWRACGYLASGQY